MTVLSPSLASSWNRSSGTPVPAAPGGPQTGGAGAAAGARTSSPRPPQGSDDFESLEVAVDESLFQSLRRPEAAASRTPASPSAELAESLTNPLSRLTPEEITQLTQAATGLPVENPIPTEELERMAGAGKLTPADQKALSQLATQARSEHRNLHGRIKAGDKSAGEPLADIHLFLDAYQTCADVGEHRIYEEAVTRIAGGTPAEHPSTVTLFAGLDEKDAGMREVVERLNGLAAGQSPILIEGNQVDLLVRGEIWQAKMQMLDQAVAEARQGKPAEIDVQYYELSSPQMLEKLTEAARAGCPVRVNLDPGRLERESSRRTFDASDLPRKMQTVFQLLEAAPGANLGVTIFPVARELGNPENLMHRKLFRVGDRVILGGVNASASSGDNVDSAFRIQGPAAARLVEVFERDVNTSAGADLKDVFGTRQLSTIQAANCVLGPSGLVALWENLQHAAGGSFPAAAANNRELVARAGDQMASLVQLEDLNGDGKADQADLEEFLDRGRTPGNVLNLTPEGADRLYEVLESGVEGVNQGANLQNARKISHPDGAVRGTQKLALGDLPPDREAILLEAIKNADRFVYLPDFVMTRPVALAVAARKQELKARGQELEVKVVADAGIYPDGHSPNDLGMRAVEDSGFEGRWSMLLAPVAGQDRKLHQKAVITDKMMMTGSTNMSRKGLTENWELSGLLYFQGPDDPNRNKAVEDFMRTWNEESVELNSGHIATVRLEKVTSRDKATRIEEARYGVTGDILNGLARYEEASREALNRLAEATPGVREEAARLQASGMAPGYALQQALREKVGPERIQAEARQSGAYQDLVRLQQGEVLGFCKEGEVCEQ